MTEHQDGVGSADGLERLWTPYRMAYIRGENKPADEAAGHQCPFCRIPTLDDEEGLVVHRGDLTFVVLNLYPYSPGHLMVCPYRHVPDYTELTAEDLHQHVVPRWAGDQNFMPIIGRTKTLPQLLTETRDLLADAWR